VGRVEPGSDAGERTLRPSSASGSSETLPGSALGTPGYMSPEQAEGDLDRLGPRSDVYSLGATLYCLLTGKPPFEGEVAEVIRAVQRGDFRPPRQLEPAMDQALEAVCLNAMAHKAGERYATPRALADDIEPWLADEPVTAWNEPLSRRARRWARRNRTPLTAPAVAIMAGVVGLAAILAVQTEAKGRLARANAQLRASLEREATANTELAVSNSALADANGELKTAKASIQARYDLAVEAIKTFHTGVSEDFLLKEEAFKELRDRLLNAASEFYGKLGALLGKQSDLASRRALGQANYEVAELTGKVGRNEDALAAHQRVLAYREALAGEAGAEADAGADIGRSLTAVAGLLESAGKPDAALATYRNAETLLADLVKQGPIAAGTSARFVLAACRSDLGRLLGYTGHGDEGLKMLRAARAELESLTAARATSEALNQLANTVGRISSLLGSTGKPAEALAEQRAALLIWTDLADLADRPKPSQRPGVEP
jgi:hypothetical protein